MANAIEGLRKEKEVKLSLQWMGLLVGFMGLQTQVSVIYIDL